jgi:hypothetical protein
MLFINKKLYVEKIGIVRLELIVFWKICKKEILFIKLYLKICIKMHMMYLILNMISFKKSNIINYF